MGEITAEQLYTLFGDLKSLHESQLRSLTKIESIVSERFTGVTDQINNLKNTFETYANKIASSVKEAVKDISEKKSSGEDRQSKQDQLRKIDTTITDRFKAISSSFLTREDMLSLDQRKPEKKVKKVEIEPERLPTRFEKQSLKELNLLNTRMSLLLKEVKEDKKEKGDSGIRKFLTPFLLLFGGIAALSYGVMKMPNIKRMLTDLTSGGIGRSLSSLIDKIKPKDKSITEWLRGLPLVGRFFDIYDAFKAFVKGDYKQGLKHLAFALPGGEMIIEILGSSKKEFLAPGGARTMVEGISLQKIYQNIGKKIMGVFDPIATFFKKIQTAFKPMISGTWEGITSGLTLLSDYFPSIKPAVKFLQGITDDIFESSMAAAAREEKGDLAGLGPINLGDILKTTVKSIYTGIIGFFNKIATIFGKVGEFVSAIGNVFSDNYSKQAMGLSVVDQFAPGVGSLLRGALNLADTFKSLDIKDDDSLMTIFSKLAFGGFKASNKYSRDKTFMESQSEYARQIKALPEDSDERKRLQEQRRLEVIDYKIRKAEEEKEARKKETYERGLYASSLEGMSNTIMSSAAAGRDYGLEKGGLVGGGLGGIGGFGVGVGKWALEYSNQLIGMTGAGSLMYKGLENLGVQGDLQWRSHEQRMKEFDKATADYTNRYEAEIKKLQALRDEALGITSDKIKTYTPSPATQQMMAPGPTVESAKLLNQSVRDANPQVREIEAAKSAGSILSSDDIKTAFEEANKPMLVKLDKLTYLEEMYLFFKEQNKYLASIERSNASMEQRPSSSTSVVQGPTYNNYASRTVSPNMRPAFDQPVKLSF